ncbi:MAG: hypothetical protein ACREFU_04490 [Acetobacteraceae bacterium]
MLDWNREAIPGARESDREEEFGSCLTAIAKRFQERVNSIGETKEERFRLG